MESGKFANSKRRMIQMSKGGAAFIRTTAGKKSYNPKAMFKKNSDGMLRKITASNSVPSKIAPARIPAAKKATGGPRKARSNKGVKRGPMGGPRKARSNKGVKRGPMGPREATLYRMVFGSAKMPGGPRKVRSNKGVKRGPMGPRKARVNRGMAASTRSKRTAMNPFSTLMR
jgi:hypothetical protein